MNYFSKTDIDWIDAAIKPLDSRYSAIEIINPDGSRTIRLSLVDHVKDFTDPIAVVNYAIDFHKQISKRNLYSRSIFACAAVGGISAKASGGSFLYGMSIGVAASLVIQLISGKYISSEKS